MTIYQLNIPYTLNLILFQEQCMQESHITHLFFVLSLLFYSHQSHISSLHHLHLTGYYQA